MIIRSTLKADKVTADRIKSDPKVTVFEGYTVSKVSGTDFVESVEIVSSSGERRTLSVGGIFVEIGLDPNTSFVKGLVDMNDRGEIVIDDHCRTNIRGLFACGDVTTVPMKQIVIAAGEGAKAAMSAYAYVNSLK
jgi:NADH-dependent peroxiredoxin subunit F